MSSQFGQDQLVIELLGGLRGGFFLDSGASDGITGSNTYRLELEYGWNGICVEPNQTFFRRLRSVRRCHCTDVCLYTKDGTVEFVEAGTLGGILAEYDPTHLQFVDQYEQARFGRALPRSEKRTWTIRRVLQSFNAPSVIDYWSLDVEGAELTLLQSFPFDQYQIRVITVEHNRLPAREKILQFLTQKGFHRIAQLEIDDCYTTLLRPPSSWRSYAFTR